MIIIIGAGGHAKVVADLLVATHSAVAGYLDDDPVTWNTVRVGVPVLGPINSIIDYDPSGIVCAIGDNRTRHRIVNSLSPELQARWINAIHPSAIIAPSARLGIGVVVAAGAIINADAELHDHVIVNTGATVDHDCVIASFAHVGPGCHIAGSVNIGEGAFLGIGSLVSPGRSVGQWSVIGAGATVIYDIPDHVIAKGTPARW